MSSTALQSRPRAVALVVVLLVATPVAAVTAADATRQPTATRDVTPSTVAPGEELTVEVTVEVPDDEDKMSIEEMFDPALSEVTVQDVRFEAGDGTVLLAIGRDDALVVALENVSAGSRFTLVYTAEVPDDVGADAIEFDGAVGQDGETTAVGGDGSVTVEDAGTTTTTSTTTGTTTDTTTTSTTTRSTTTDSTTTDSTTDSTTTRSTTGSTATGSTTTDSTGPTTGSTATTTATAGSTTDDTAGTTSTDDGGADGGGQSVPGFGVGVAVLALLAAGLLAARRRER